MSEYIIWESDKTETTDNLGMKHGVSHFEKREEIVRCRDCKHYEDYTGCCMRRDYVAPMAVTASGFCKWGERREP